MDFLIKPFLPDKVGVKNLQGFQNLEGLAEPQFWL